MDNEISTDSKYAMEADEVFTMLLTCELDKRAFKAAYVAYQLAKGEHRVVDSLKRERSAEDQEEECKSEGHIVKKARIEGPAIVAAAAAPPSEPSSTQKKSGKPTKVSLRKDIVTLLKKSMKNTIFHGEGPTEAKDCIAELKLTHEDSFADLFGEAGLTTSKPAAKVVERVLGLDDLKAIFGSSLNFLEAHKVQTYRRSAAADGKPVPSGTESVKLESGTVAYSTTTNKCKVVFKMLNVSDGDKKPW